MEVPALCQPMSALKSEERTVNMVLYKGTSSQGLYKQTHGGDRFSLLSSFLHKTIRLGAGVVAKLLEHLTNMYKPWAQFLAPYESGMMMGGSDDDRDGIEDEEAAAGASDNDSCDERDDDSVCNHCSA